MRTLGVTAVVMTSLFVVFVWSLDAAVAQPSASRVIDRTLRCTTGIQAGVRELLVDTQSGLRSDTKPATWKSLPNVELHTPGTDRGPQQSILAAISAGGPLESSSAGGGLSIGPGRCKTIRARVPLAAANLERQVVRGYPQHWVCIVPRWILLHVHGAFRAPTSLQANPFGYLSTLGATARSGSLAVRTETGRPLLFAAVNESGAARLFAANSCTEH
jgi:hypothetical protein